MEDKSKLKDDLEAVRIIVDALQGFDSQDSDRIIRWAKEKLGLVVPQRTDLVTGGQPSPAVMNPIHPSTPRKNIKSFIENKKPKGERQLAAVVAYYHAFEAIGEEHKDAIDANDLREACRKANVTRPNNPNQSLINASQSGYLDKGGKAGSYRINAVGENLVAMILPEGSLEKRSPVKRHKVTKSKPRK